ncbi:hypothetical protein CPB97_006272 [Podila verticillata]|nr:hypothetical protein CPB97_006272 [Podila verticillata]
MNSNTTSNSGNNAQRSSINNRHGEGSMLSQLEHLSHHDTPVKMSALHDRTADSRIAGDDFGGLSPKDHYDSGAGSKQRDSGFIDFTSSDSNQVHHGLNSMFFKKETGHGDHSSASISPGLVHDDHSDHHGNHTGFSITGLSTLSHKDPSSHVSTGHSMIPTQSTRQDSSDLSLGALYVEDQASSARMVESNHEEKQSGSSQSSPLGHQTHRAHSPSPKHTSMPHHNKELDRDGDKISSQGVHQTIHRSGVDSDGLFDSAHPSTFPSTKHKQPSKGGEKSHEPEINIGELPKHDRFKGPVEYLEDDHTISQHDPQYSHGAPLPSVLGAGAGLVSLGAAAAAASHHISNPPAVNYAASILDAHNEHTPPSSSHVEAIHKPSGPMSASSTGTKESELGRAGSQSSTSTSNTSSAPVSTAPKKKTWFGFEIRAKEKDPNKPPKPLSLGYGFKETRKAAMAAAKAKTAPPKASISAPISTPIMTPSAPAAISAQGVHASSAGASSSSSNPATVSAQGAHLATNEGPSSLAIATTSTQGLHDPANSGSSSSGPAAISAQGVHAASNAGPTSSASVSNPSIVSVQPIHHVGRSSPAPHSFSPSQDRPVHPDITYHTKKKSKKAGGSNLFSAPKVPAGMGRSHLPPKAPISSSDALSTHVSSLTSVPVHSQHQHHINSPVTPEILTAAVAAGAATAAISHHHGHSEEALLNTTANPTITASTAGAAAPSHGGTTSVAQSVSRDPIPSTSTAVHEAVPFHSAGLSSTSSALAHPPAAQASHTDSSSAKAAAAATVVTAPVIAAAVEHHDRTEPKTAAQSIPEKANAVHWILPHEHATAAILKKPKVDLSLYPEEESTYPRGEESHHENPDHPEHPVVVQEVQLDAKDQHAHSDLHLPKQVVANAAHWILPHEHATAAILKKPKVDLSLYPEEESTYPRGEESHHENPDHPEHPVVVQEVQLDAKDQHAHSDLHLSKQAVAAAAVASGLESIKSAFSNIHLPGVRKSDTPKEDVGATSTTTTAVEKETDATPVTPISDLASARAAAASTLATSPTPDDSKSKFSTAEHGHPDEGSSISARQVEPFVAKPNATVLVTDKATSTGPSAAVSSHPATSKASTAGSHPVHAEIGTSTHPVDPSATTSTTSKSGTAVPLTIAAGAVPVTIAAAAVTAPLAAHLLNKHDDVDAEKTIATSTTVHDEETTEAKHNDESATSKPTEEAHVTTTVDDDTLEAAIVTAAVETEKERKRREKKELKKEQKELKAKEKAEKKALKEKEKKPPVDISGKLSSIAAPAVAAIAAASASPSNPHNKDTAPIKLRGQKFLLSESDVEHPTVVPVSQTLHLTEDDVEYPSVPIVSQKLTLNEDDVEKPVLVQPPMPVLRLHEEDVPKPDISHGHLVIPVVAPKAVSTSALKVAKAPRPMIPPRPIVVKKEKAKTDKKLRIPKVRMPKFKRNKASKVKEEKAVVVGEPMALAIVPVVETGQVIEAPKPVVETHVVESPKPHVVETHVVESPKLHVVETYVVESPKLNFVETYVVGEPKLNFVETYVVGEPKPAVGEVAKPVSLAAINAAAIALPPSPKPAVVQKVKTPHVEVPKPAAIAAVTAAAAVALPPSPKPVPTVVDTKSVEAPKPVVDEPLGPVPVAAPIAAAPVVAAPATSAMKPITTAHEHTPAPQKEDITAESVPVVAPIAAAPVVAAPATSAMKSITTAHEHTPAPQKEEITAKSVPVVTAPEGYTGPIPSINSGEKVVWVKKVYTSQEYYDSDEDDFDEFGYRKDRDPSRYLPRLHEMSNADQRAKYNLQNHTRPSTEALAQQQMPVQQQQQRQSAM